MENKAAAGMGGFWSDLKSMISTGSEQSFPEDKELGSEVPVFKALPAAEAKAEKKNLVIPKGNQSPGLDIEALIFAMAKTNTKELDYKKLMSIIQAIKGSEKDDDNEGLQMKPGKK